MKRKLFGFKGLLTLLLGLITFSVSAQTVTIQGLVTDASGEPIIGATIIVENNPSQGTITNIDGKYVFPNVPSDANLVFSYVGMKTEVVAVNQRTTINVVMKEDSELLSEVVVTALGITKQQRSVGYATSSVSTAEIERINAINPITALQGKVAGLDINLTGASGVTSSSSITIRGAKSIDKNNSPIFVVDGMIIQEPLRGALDGTDWGSQLKNLNPADYESVTVLKGAAATALYGSRGANGAIVIKSKGGKYGKQGLGV
ncbi:TonB-dependent receptor SusC [bioreactor metagenome]|uniref:TonB-dependent receptor SusC n=2 Tax=root TaxID=1 RepID=A0A645FR42_9ZZZZ